MLHKKTSSVLCALAAIALLATLLPVPAASALEDPRRATSDLPSLLPFLNAPTRNAGDEDDSCGTKGKCNYTSCPDPGCGEDQVKGSCSCTATGDECGWLTKYPVYNCTCECVSQPEEPQTPPPKRTCVEVEGEEVACVTTESLRLL